MLRRSIFSLQLRIKRQRRKMNEAQSTNLHGYDPQPLKNPFPKVRGRIRELRLARHRPHILKEMSVDWPDEDPRGVIPVETRENVPQYLMDREAFRPTHFLSFPVTHGNIIDSMQSFQQELLSNIRESDPKIIPASRLHITLGLLRIVSNSAQGPTLGSSRCGTSSEGGDVVRAQLDTVLRILREVSDTVPPPIRLRLRGVGAFRRGEVLFARVTPELHSRKLYEYVQQIRRALHRAGIQIIGAAEDNFIPHCTLAKMRRVVVAPRSPQHGKPEKDTTIPYEAYASMVGMSFGEHNFDTLRLCAMRGANPVDDGYNTIAEIPLGEKLLRQYSEIPRGLSRDLLRRCGEFVV